MSEEEKINTSITDRMTLISQAVCEKMMNACSQRENEKFEFLSEEVEQLKSDIATGLKDIKNIIETKQQQTKARWWDVAQILISVLLTAVIAFKFH